ncbi:hypothetical protein ACFWIJ_42345 [Streptomyces sp. NPDC127079]|uniref:hypothetical protein n=1 Tax=Streptomyces sp. NPDC127079 TaxID=3347132 RepID=UPI003664C216
MAAFQRGIGLAEAQQHLEATQPEPPAPATTPTEPAPPVMGALDTEVPGAGGGAGAAGGDPASSTSGATHVHAAHDHLADEYMSGDYLTQTHLSWAHRDPADPPSGSRSSSRSQALRPVHTSEFTTRPDGSTPAG